MRHLQTTDNNFLTLLTDQMSPSEKRILANQVVAHLHDHEIMIFRQDQQVNDDYATNFVMQFFRDILKKRRNDDGY